MWKIIKAIKSGLESIDDFLTMCEDYVDLRMRAGKTPGDVKVLTKKVKVETHETVASTSTRIYESTLTQYTLAILKKHWTKLMRIAPLENIASVVIDSLILVKKFYGELFIIFGPALTSFLILLNLFESSPILFSLGLFPIILLNSFLLSSLCYFIDRNEKGEKTSLWVGFDQALRQFPPLATIIFTHIFVFLQAVILFFVFALFLNYSFTFINLDWTNSFLYWFIIVFMAILTAIILFIFGIAANQAYYYVLLEKISPSQAFKKGWSMVKKHSFTFLFLYSLFSLLAIWLVYRSTLAYFHIGFIISIFFFVSGISFLAFLLRRKFLHKNITAQEIFQPSRSPIFNIIFVFGFFTYVLISFFLIQQYPTIINILEQAQENLLVEKQFTKTYTNDRYGYTFNYPEHWDYYGGTDNSITIYNNYTGDLNGGIWLTITASPFSRPIFDKLRNSRTGLISYDPKTTDTVTKISNVTIDGLEAINYTFLKAELPYPQYQLHYLIHKDDKMYTIVITTMSKEVEQRNSLLFEKIIKSFRFIEQKS